MTDKFGIKYKKNKLLFKIKYGGEKMEDKKEFVKKVLSDIKKEEKDMKPDDWRGLLHNWIKC